MGQLIDTGKKSPDLTFIPEDVIEYIHDRVNRSYFFWYKLAEMQVEEEKEAADNNNTSK